MVAPQNLVCFRTPRKTANCSELTPTTPETYDSFGWSFLLQPVFFFLPRSRITSNTNWYGIHLFPGGEGLPLEIGLKMLQLFISANFFDHIFP